MIEFFPGNVESFRGKSSCAGCGGGSGGLDMMGNTVLDWADH